MAILQCTFFSETLEMMTGMTVILPESPEPNTPWVYLLHGLMDDHTVWCRRTSVERYATARGLAVVMPFGGRSFYTDMAHGGKFWTYISQEVPYRARQFFPLSRDRKRTFVAGNSMGGYGAFKLALRMPDYFAAAISLSGVLDLATWVATPPNRFTPDLENIFGSRRDIGGSDNDLLFWATELQQSGFQPEPMFYQWCGTDDFLYEDNVRFRDHASAAGLDLTYEESTGGHEWALWDRQILRAFQWLPL